MPPDRVSGDPAWSRDGSRLAFGLRDRQGNADVYVAGANGSGSPIRVTRTLLAEIAVGFRTGPLPPSAPCTIAGTPHADVLRGTAGDDLIYGLGGADTLDGRGGDDYVDGGDGDDRLLGGAEYDVLDGGSGDDVLEGGFHNDVLDGGAGHDTLTGGDGSDRFRAWQGGRDRLDGLASTSPGPTAPIGASRWNEQCSGGPSSARSMPSLTAPLDPAGGAAARSGARGCPRTRTGSP